MCESRSLNQMESLKSVVALEGFLLLLAQVGATANIIGNDSSTRHDNDDDDDDCLCTQRGRETEREMVVKSIRTKRVR